jgi:hypothetical protein
MVTQGACVDRSLFTLLGHEPQSLCKADDVRDILRTCPPSKFLCPAGLNRQ